MKFGRARYNGSSWWWGALGNCKTGPGGITDRTAIFDCAWAQVPASDQTSCLRDKLLVTDQTQQGIDVVVAYNAPPTCDQLFARYNGSSWWWGALGNCKTGPGGITDRTAIFDCAWAQVPASDQTSCLRDELLATDQTRQGIDVVVAYNTLNPRLDYARACEAEMGKVPGFDCLKGEELPITLNGVPVTEPRADCDKPVALTLGNESKYQCVPYSRLLRLSTSNPNVETVAICRKYKNDTARSPTNVFFHDIAVVQYNKVTGNTCFHQSAIQQLDGTTVPSPMEDSTRASDYWRLPSEVVNCLLCHDADPFIRSPYIKQKADDTKWNPLGPYHGDFLGIFNGGADPKTIRPEGNECSSCHRIGVRSWNNVMKRAGILESMPPASPIADRDAWRAAHKAAVDQIEACIQNPAAAGCGSN